MDEYQDYGSEDPYSIFIFAMNAPQTREKYTTRLDRFFRFINVQGNTIQERCKAFAEISKNDNIWALNNVRKFLQVYKERVERKEITGATIRNYVKSIKLFCNTRGLPRRRRYVEDRAPTIEEIRKIIEYPDRRIKAIVYTMVSSGIRIGAWDYLQWKHVIPMANNSGEIIAAKLIVYAGDREEYCSFITPEAYSSLKEWMDFRSSYGEKISGESWLMRDIWQTTNIDYGAKWGLATNPKRLKSSGIKRLLERALWEQGIRQPLKEGAKRHEWKAAHGFHKFYKSHAEQVMRPINVEITTGHNIGISASYYKPTEKEFLEDYIKAVDLLTISNDKVVLGKQVAELTQKSKDNEYIIRGKLQEKDEEMKTMKEQFNTMQSQLQTLISTLSYSDQEGKQEIAKKLIEQGHIRRKNRLYIIAEVLLWTLQNL